MNKPNFRAEANNKRLRLDIYDTIGADWLGQGITAKTVAAAIAAAGDVDQIDVYINSPGGDAFDGIAIYNELKQFEGVVNTYAMGIAASAASVIFMAGDQRVVYDGAQLMIHNAAGFTFGDKNVHTKQTAVLSKLDRSIATLYAATTGGDVETIAEMMNEETWLDTSDAIDDGYATHRAPQEAVAPPQSRLLNAYSNVPLKVAAWAGQASGVNPQPTTELPKMADEPVKPDEDQEEETVEDKIAALEARIAELEAMGDEDEMEEEEPGTDAKAIANAFGHDKEFVVEMIAAGKTLNEAYPLYVARTTKLADTNRRLAAEMQNGEDPVALAVQEPEETSPADDSPSARAAWEWDNGKKVFNASTRDRYVASRTAELEGRFKVI